jgi:restriction system protein
VAQSYYWIEISNQYLGKYRKVTGRTRREVELKAAEQLQRWEEQEARAFVREAAADAKEQARLDTEAALTAIEEHRSILAATLDVDDRLNWSAMVDSTSFGEPAPTLADIRVELGVPGERRVMERLSKKAVRARQEAEKNADEVLGQRRRAWEERKEAHERAQMEHNEAVDSFRTAYEAGDPDAVERYVSLVLARSVFPSTFSRECAVAYSAADKTIVVNVPLPTPDELPQVVEYRFVASRGVIDEKQMKDKELGELYDQVVVQTVLRTLHEIFEGDYAEHCIIAVVNGTIEAVDRATGKDYVACIVSCQAERGAFLELDLSRIDPLACFRSLKGLSGSKMIGLQPVRPIRELNTEDARFIEASDVLDGLEAGQNLMTMEWQDFEVLVRDLFEQMFHGRGGEVKVTRTSRDQGVDAVVFDPDPLVGGKTVIQAKRYRGTVPVAAVRELYGTMINEGAGKGILVTTSHFGASALEFAKDKPLTLLDGAHLLHLLQNHGHQLRIDLSEGVEDAVLENVPN